MTPYTLADAERDLRAALQTGDPDAITAASAKVDELDPGIPAVPLVGAALYYAEIGLRVFPLSPGTKMPFPMCAACKNDGDAKCAGPETCGHDLCHGLKDATTDPARVTRWWAERPEANIGIATGHIVDVVDIDGAAGQKSRAEQWETIFGTIDADALGKVLTPRAGGMHIYVPVTGMGNSTNIAPSVDYRGLGGYVVAPPSRTPVGTYRWLGKLELTAAVGAA